MGLENTIKEVIYELEVDNTGSRPRFATITGPKGNDVCLITSDVVS
jgi:hypothetical protein